MALFEATLERDENEWPVGLAVSVKSVEYLPSGQARVRTRARLLARRSFTTVTE